MATVISIISLIAAVLQIILFFKIWDMCNDIKAMRQQTVPPSDKKNGSSTSIIIVAAIIIIWLLAVIFLVI